MQNVIIKSINKQHIFIRIQPNFVFVSFTFIIELRKNYTQNIETDSDPKLMKSGLKINLLIFRWPLIQLAVQRM